MDFISFPPQTEHDLNCADDNHSLTDAAVSMMLWFDESWAAVGKHSLFSCSLITSLVNDEVFTSGSDTTILPFQRLPDPP